MNVLVILAMLFSTAMSNDVPAGDCARGRAAFIALQCHSCHQVAEDRSLPRVEGVWKGPELRDLGRLSPGTVAWLIVSQTRLSPEAIFETPMTEPASAMTESQLVDLVTYLRDPRGASNPKP